MLLPKSSRSGAMDDTYQTIASQLVVDGMFNINSVSLDAWKAILRHNRDTETPYITASGSTVTDSATSFPYPRTSIAGDRSADSGAGTVSNGSNPDAAEFAGYRALTDEQIDAPVSYTHLTLPTICSV